MLKDIFASLVPQISLFLSVYDWAGIPDLWDQCDRTGCACIRPVLILQSAKHVYSGVHYF
jgi:hypothetical protein